MNRFFYHLAKTFPIVPIKTLAGLTGQRTIFPFYHAVSNHDPIHIKHLYKIRSIKEFEKDLDFLCENFVPTSMLTFLEKSRSDEPLKQNSFILSFDDGLSEFHDVIAPILLRKGIPAICFLNSGFIDNRDLFFRYKASILVEKIKNAPTPTLVEKAENWIKDRLHAKKNFTDAILSINYASRVLLDDLACILEVEFDNYLKEVKPYMNSDQIHSLVQNGFTFGSHSIDHPQYKDIAPDEQMRQTRESINDIRNHFYLDYKVFSFPFTDDGVSKKFFSQVFDHSQPIADLTFGCAGLKNDCCKGNIQRIPIETDNFTASDIMRGEYYYYIAKSLFNKNTISRGN